MEFISEVLEYSYLQRSLVTAVGVGIISGLIGSFIILRGMALMGDAISHAILPGIAISYMMGINYFYGAVVFGILATVGIGAISQHSRIKHDSSIGIVFSAFFALGVILVSKTPTATDLTRILFGNVLAVRLSDMWLTIGIGILIVIVIALFYKELLISTFDETMAQVYGLNTTFIHYVIMILLTMATVASLQTVGVVLVVAMLITPAATAYLLTNKFIIMLILSTIFGTVSSVIGLYFSVEYNLPSGAAIVLVATAFFMIAFLFSPKQGVLWRAFRQKQKVRSTS